MSTRRFYPLEGRARDLPWMLLYALTFGLALVAGLVRGVLLYVPVEIGLLLTHHDPNGLAANVILTAVVVGPLVWSLTALVCPLGAGRAWQTMTGGRAPSERERELVDDALAEIHERDPTVRRPRGVVRARRPRVQRRGVRRHDDDHELHPRGPRLDGSHRARARASQHDRLPTDRRRRQAVHAGPAADPGPQRDDREWRVPARAARGPRRPGVRSRPAEARRAAVGRVVADPRVQGRRVRRQARPRRRARQRARAQRPGERPTDPLPVHLGRDAPLHRASHRRAQQYARRHADTTA